MIVVFLIIFFNEEGGGKRTRLKKVYQFIFNFFCLKVLFQ